MDRLNPVENQISFVGKPETNLYNDHLQPSLPTLSILRDFIYIIYNYGFRFQRFFGKTRTKKEEETF